MADKFCFEETSISGLIKIRPFFAPDERGFFSKVFEKEIFCENGIQMEPFEELQSYSHKGVIRGLHFQHNHSQDKLVRVLNGKVFDVAVDLRSNSYTFGKWQGFYLSAENREMLYIPKGFAHGFLAMEENTLFSYLCGDCYDPKSEDGILWNDKELDVKWPLDNIDKVIISEKDQKLQTFCQFKTIYNALI